MDYLSKLENQSIYILREAFNKFENLAMLWSIGKDSTVLLWLARKAFLGHVPFPLVHVDTTYKIPSMIEYRDRLVKEWKLQLIVGKNEEVLKSGITFPNGKATRASSQARCLARTGSRRARLLSQPKPAASQWLVTSMTRPVSSAQSGTSGKKYRSNRLSDTTQ